jgi:hypothetical protein
MYIEEKPCRNCVVLAIRGYSGWPLVPRPITVAALMLDH